LKIVIKNRFNMKKMNILFTAILFLAVFNSAYSQIDKTFSESVDIVRAYLPKITDAVKMDIVPVGEKMESQKPNITYTAKSKLIQLETTNNNKLSSLSFIKSPRKDFDHFYLKAGFGNYNNLLIDAHYNTTLLADRALTLRVFNHSGKSTVKYSNASEQLADIAGRKDFGTKTLSGRLNVNNSNYRFYGFRIADSVNFDTIDPKNIKNNYLSTSFKLSFNNENEKKEKVHYWANLGVVNLYDYFKFNEFGITFSGKIEQYFNQNPIRFETQINHYIYSSPNSLNYHRTLFNVKAGYIFLRDRWRAEVGFNAPTESDTSLAKTHFYPNVLLEAALVESYFNVFGGIRGDLIQNNYQSLIDENPFIISKFELRNTNNKFEIFGGIKGNVGSKFRYLAQFSYHNIENLLLFVNSLNADSTFNQRFTPIYDSSNTNLTRIKLEAGFTPINNMDIFATFSYDKYDQNPPEAYAWHLPSVQTKLTARYTLQEKITFNLDYFFIGKRFAKDPFYLTTPIDLPAISDMNFGITYKFVKTWSIFFQFNNLTNNKYSYWNNYDLRGFNFLVGGKAIF